MCVTVKSTIRLCRNKQVPAVFDNVIIRIGFLFAGLASPKRTYKSQIFDIEIRSLLCLIVITRNRVLDRTHVEIMYPTINGDFIENRRWKPMLYNVQSDT